MLYHYQFSNLERECISYFEQKVSNYLAVLEVSVFCESSVPENLFKITLREVRF